MHKVYDYFPLSSAVEMGNVRQFATALAIYLVACGVLGVLSAVLGWIPLVGWLLKTVFSLLGLYCVAGIILAVFRFVKH